MAIVKRERRGAGISLLVPFRVNDPGDRRAITWNWLRQYWENVLPDAEIIIGTHDDGIFSKTTAVNRAALQAKGDILVILDADCYIPEVVILDCAMQIRNARKQDQRLWFMPYRRFWRLSDEASQRILESDPKYPRPVIANTVMPTIAELDRSPDKPYHPHRPPRHHHHRWVNAPDSPNPAVPGVSGESPLIEARGHWYGALIQIMPREAFFTAGMMDIRFAGWGGEDVSFMHCVDTLYARHRTTPNGVFHLWHPLAQDADYNRMWPMQERANLNSRLATRYSLAMGDKDRMQKLVNEHYTVKRRNLFIRGIQWLSQVVRNLWRNFKLACARFL